MEAHGYIFLSCGKEWKKKDLLQFELFKREKSTGTLEMLSHALDSFGFGA